MSDLLPSLRFDDDRPLIIPEVKYASAWVEFLVNYSPDMKSVAHKLFARLANWQSWEAGTAAASRKEWQLLDLEDLDVDDRIRLTAGQRSVMVHEFGIRPRCANAIAWNNPVGAQNFYTMEMELSDVFLMPGELDPLELEKEFAELDRLNKTLLWKSPECIERLTEFTRPEVYAALFKHLGWSFSPSDEADDEIPEAVPVNLIGHISDPEAGNVAVYCIPFSSNPGTQYDQLKELALHTLRERQRALGTKVLLMFSHPYVRSYHQGENDEDAEISAFGELLLEDMQTWLLLPSQAISFADLFVDLVASHKTGQLSVVDVGFETALRFEHMRRRKDPLIPENDSLQPVVCWNEFGWDHITFEPM